jgi:hypothetical protein
LPITIRVGLVGYIGSFIALLAFLVSSRQHPPGIIVFLVGLFAFSVGLTLALNRRDAASRYLGWVLSRRWLTLGAPWERTFLAETLFGRAFGAVVALVGAAAMFAGITGKPRTGHRQAIPSWRTGLLPCLGLALASLTPRLTPSRPAIGALQRTKVDDHCGVPNSPRPQRARANITRPSLKTAGAEDVRWGPGHGTRRARRDGSAARTTPPRLHYPP